MALANKTNNKENISLNANVINEKGSILKDKALKENIQKPDLVAFSNSGKNIKKNNKSLSLSLSDSKLNDSSGKRHSLRERKTSRLSLNNTTDNSRTNKATALSDIFKAVDEKEKKTPANFKILEDETKSKKKSSKVVKKKSINPAKVVTKQVKPRVSFPETKKKSIKNKNLVQDPRRSLVVETVKEKDKEINSVPDELTVKSPSPKKSPAKTSLKSPKSSVEKKFEMDKDLAILENMFTNIDPAFLKTQYIKMKRSLEDTVNLISSRKTKEDSQENKIKLNTIITENIQKKYTTNFSVDEFIKIVLDPWNFFLNTELYNSINYAEHSFYYLKNKFTKHYLSTIQDTLVKSKYSLYRAHKELSDKRKCLMYKMRTTERIKKDCASSPPLNFDFQFLLEVAFIEHESEITEKLKELEDEKFKKLKCLIKGNSLSRCQNCNVSNLLWENVIFCSNEHIICKDCINRHVEGEIGRQNFRFECPLFCGELLPEDNLMNFLSPDSVSILSRKRQCEELISAGFTDIFYCYICYYMKITPLTNQTVFYCINPSCSKETCTLCKNLNHQPLNCDEFQETLEVPKLDLSVCSHCNNKFIKIEDSIKMICSCGSEICYICRLPYLHCPHFNNESEDQSIVNSLCEVHENISQFEIEEETRSISPFEPEIQINSDFSFKSSGPYAEFLPSDSIEF